MLQLGHGDLPVETHGGGTRPGLRKRLQLGHGDLPVETPEVDAYTFTELAASIGPRRFTRGNLTIWS